MSFLGIPYELIFMHNLLDLSCELLNPNLFFSLLDTAFTSDSENKKNLPIVVILSIFSIAEKYLIGAKSYRLFIYILKFCGKSIFRV